MLRTALGLIAAVCAIGLFMTPTASAQPAFCDHHGSGAGSIYIHACASGGGGGGSYLMVKDVNGRWVKVKRQDVLTGKWKGGEPDSPAPSE